MYDDTNYFLTFHAYLVCVGYENGLCDANMVLPMEKEMI